MTALLLLSGLVLLIAGGELLVRGAVRLALTLHTSPLIIGLTVVAFGTSSPELAVSLFAALSGSADLAIGNVVGSNIFNVLFILGLSALIVPLLVSQQLIRLDVPVMIGVSVVLLWFAANGVVSRFESVLLVLALVGYIVLQIVMSRNATAVEEPTTAYAGKWYVDVALTLFGLVVLVLGSRWFVNGAVGLARTLGVSELVIGLTFVAAGTSMPEVATSVIAGMRGQRDIAVGNVIGSNIFNILAVIGITGLAAPGGVAVSAAAIAIDIPIMLAVAALCFPIFLSGYTISRWEGILFLGYYGLYATYLVLDAARHDVTNYRNVVLLIVVPVTVLTVIAFTFQSWRDQRRE